MNARIALRLSARRRKAVADEACPQLLRVRSHAERVLCDTDLYSKPLIPRRYQDAAGALLMLAIWIGLFFLGGIS